MIYPQLKSPPNSNPESTARRQRGIALPFALVMISIIMLCGVTFLIASTNDLTLANAQSNDNQSVILAEAAIYRAKTILRSNSSYLIRNYGTYGGASGAPHSELLLSPFYSFSTDNERAHLFVPANPSWASPVYIAGLNKSLFFGSADDNKTDYYYSYIRKGQLVPGLAYSYTNGAGPQWNYITSPFGVDYLNTIVNDATHSSNQRVIGRFAFLGLTGGKVSLATALPDFNDWVDTPRTGCDPREIRAHLALVDRQITNGTLIDASTARGYFEKLAPKNQLYLSPEKTGKGGLTEFPDIFTFTRMLKSVGANIEPKNAIQLSANYTTNNSPCYELFRRTVVSNLHGTYTRRDYRHRFNLNRSSKEWKVLWDNMFGSPSSPKLTQSTNFRDMAGSNMRNANTNATRYTAGLDFFTLTGEMPAGIHSTKAMTKENVAATLYANLKDYMDEDHESTCYISNDNVVYAGLECAPLVNEVGLEFSLEKKGPEKGNYTYVFNLARAKIELVNLYKNGVTDVVPEINLEIEVELDGKKTISVKNVSCPSISVAHGSYSKNVVSQTFKTTPIQITTPSANLGAPKIQIKYLRVNLYGGTGDKNTYSSGGKPLCQVAQPVLRDITSDKLAKLTLTSDAWQLGEFYVDFEATDPRSRFIPEGWVMTSSTDEDAVFSFEERNRAIKTTYTPNKKEAPDALTQDPEPQASDPWEVSTAYIRNAPMQSPWELGFIHRIRPWQTLNLKTMRDVRDYSSASSFFNVSTAQTMESAPTGSYLIDMRYTSAKDNGYVRGDAGILDQIKWGSQVKSYGKINYNIPTEGVARALFTDIVIGKNPSDFTEGDYKLTQDDVTNMLPNVMLPNSNRRHFRGSFANAIYKAIHGYSRDDNTYQSGSRGLTKVAGLSDAEQESIMGKIACLIECESGRDAVVFVVAQTIEDVPDANGKYGTFTTDDRIVSETRLMAQFEYQQMIYSWHSYDGGNPIGAALDAGVERTNDWMVKRMIYLDPSL